MTQVVRVKPEDRSSKHFSLEDGLRSRALTIHEHAALVALIMLNFPEIYQHPTPSKEVRPASDLFAESLALLPPATA